jgi:PIN domain nuclease of toxin-antitoxin system
MVLLDTHVFLWLQTEPERLGRHLKAVEDPGTDLLLSAASSWEIAIKHGLGKLSLPEPPQEYVLERIRLAGMIGLPIEHSHALAVSSLPPLHRDPFDRMIVAQATVLGVPVITSDPAIIQYEIETIAI